MAQLKDFTGIQQEEVVYQLLKGLKEVSNILKRFPEKPQLSSIEFEFSIKESRTLRGNLGIFLAFSYSDKREYEKKEKITYDLKNIPTIRYKPASFDWKAKANNLYLEFAGSLIRQIAASIASSDDLTFRPTGYSIEESFVLTKTKTGMVGFSLLSDLLEIGGQIDISNIVQHKYKVSFNFPEKSKEFAQS